VIVYVSSLGGESDSLGGGRVGGPSTFMRYLGAYLQDRGHILTSDIDREYDVHFAVSMTKGASLLHSLRRHVPIVLRLDGVTSAPNLSKCWRMFIWPTVLLQQVVHTTVYQSEFCQRAWSVVSGGRMRGRSEIVYNGADVSRFHPVDNTRSGVRPPTIMLHEHYRRDDGGLRTALLAFAIVKGREPSAQLILAGQLSGSMSGVVEGILAGVLPEVRSAIQVIGQTDHAILPDLIRSADVFVHPVANSCCPHTVLEALACGVPVVCYSGTGPAELVGESGIVLQSEYEGLRHGFRRFPRQDPGQLAEAILEVLHKKARYRAAARRRACLFDSDRTSARYLQIFEQAIRSAPAAVTMAKSTLLVGRFQLARLISKLIKALEQVGVV
jgi:glycosyltransferase involved in cell wall biosynthesis